MNKIKNGDLVIGMMIKPGVIDQSQIKKGSFFEFIKRNYKKDILFYLSGT